MPDPTDPRAVADDPSGIVQQMPGDGDEADADLQAEIERLRAALRKINVGDGWAALIARAALYPETDGGQDAPADS